MNKIYTLLTFAFFMVISMSSNAQMAGSSTSQGKTVPICEWYDGGQTAMYTFINQNMIYPQMAKRNRIQGECIVSVVLEADGRITNVQLVKNIGGGCGEEALRLVRLLKFKAPGYRKQYTVPVYFKL